MKKNFLIPLSVFALLTILISCKKERDLKSNNKFNSSSVRFDYSNWPSVSNGILVFNDGNHIQEYLALLDTTIIDSIPDNDTFVYDPDVKLALLESNIGGFTSLRSIA